VRVEEVVVVTDNGCTVLSNASKSVNELMILEDSSFSNGAITVDNKGYRSNTSISVEYNQEEGNITHVELYDGYEWHSMDSISPIEYTYETELNESYSTRRMLIVRTVKENDTFYQFHEFEYSLQHDDAFSIGKVISANHEDTLEKHWLTPHEGAKMIRLRFSFIEAPVFAQMIIVDARGMVVEDLRGIFGFDVWTPWVYGDTLRVELVTIAREAGGGIGNYSFAMRQYQIAGVDDFNITSLTTTSGTTTPITYTETQLTSDAMVRLTLGLGTALCIILVAVIIIEKNTSH
jgi:hypothetical protein